MTQRTRASWLVYALGALSAGAIAAAILVVGPASGNQASQTRTATAAQGIVQSTVSGSGNLEAASQLDLGFKTSGTVTHIYVTQGEQVVRGQLLAALDPQSAEVTLEQAKASLQSAAANLAKEEETNGKTSNGQGSSGSGAGTATTASTTSVTATVATAHTAPATAAGNQASRAQATTTPTTTAASTPAAATPTTTSSTPTTTTTTSPATTSPATTSPARTTPSDAKKETEKEKPKENGPAKEKEEVSTATREANLASAKAAVKSDKLTVQSDEQTVRDTKLYAPEDGTIVSLSGQVGETVPGGGTTKASSSSRSSSESGSSGGAGRGASSSASSPSAASSSGSSSSSSASFAVLSNLSSMQLVVPLSESEVGHVRKGQIATVTVEALESRKLAAHVSEVAIPSTSNSGVVSYDVTFQLDQMESGLKPGMSATAEVVVKQAEGINIPTSAISGGIVTVVRGGKHVSQRVVSGLAGNSSTIILAGLTAGETIVLPVASSTGTSSLTSRLGRRLGGGGLGGGGFPLFRGGG